MDIDTAVIAHRGASGYLPEHTREAKMLAYGQGADFLEQDVVATRDGQLVVLHDIHLDEVTNVAERFGDRRRPDGHHYVIDFDLAELRTLEIVERRQPGSSRRARDGRFADDAVAFRIVTLDEEIRLIRELNRTTGRDVGLYPEIKRPDWHHRHGFDLAGALLAALDTYGYAAPDQRVFVQCFDSAELRRCREELGTRLRLVQLTENADVLTTETLGRIAQYADVVAPHYSQLVTRLHGHPAAAPLVEQIRARGLGLHTYTLRRDDPAVGGSGFERLLEVLYTVAGLDGIFCDHPDVAVRVRARLRGGDEAP
ncbi:MAG: glycerophosphodiester phosphodiesterase [Gammaproteobacteria bacterium]|nr:glycerophosphodiester phosphodiesterase [Gammaproteobacteria bacterium]